MAECCYGNRGHHYGNLNRRNPPSGGEHRTSSGYERGNHAEAREKGGRDEVPSGRLVRIDEALPDLFIGMGPKARDCKENG